MAETRRLSPAAQAMRKRGLLIWGIILLVLWLGISIPTFVFYSGDLLERAAMVVAIQFFIGLLLLLGVIFLIIGITGEVKSRKFNKLDWALADGLAVSLNDLWHQPSETAFAASDGLAAVQNARLVEIERHFDQQTEGAIAGTMTHQMRMFGTSFSSSYGSARSTGGGRSSFSSSSVGAFSGTIKGLSQVNLGVSTTTRNNLMGDALFSVFEAAGPAGERDTYRVISMSRPGVESWINDMVSFAAQQVGGPQTHAGATVLSWAGRLMAQFAPGDISYVTDRLKALAARPYEERGAVFIQGAPTGRNAVIATTMKIGAGEDLRLMPSRFPLMFGHAVATGVSNGERTLNGQAPQQSITA